MSEPKELWEVARYAGETSANECGKLYWGDVAAAVIEAHERRKSDPYAHLKAAAADPTKQIRHRTRTMKWSDWIDGDERAIDPYLMRSLWSFDKPTEHYEIRDKPKKVDWSQLSEHARKYWNKEIDGEFPSLWIPWGLPEFGDKCPVPEGVMVEVIVRDGQHIEQASAIGFEWRGGRRDDDIIAFRITGVNDQWEA